MAVLVRGRVGPGRTSWTQVLDAVRLGPDDDVAQVTAVPVRQVVRRLVTAGQWRHGDPDVLVVFDAGPGRPPGSKNRRPANRYDVGKTTKRGTTLQKRKKHSD